MQSPETQVERDRVALVLQEFVRSDYARQLCEYCNVQPTDYAAVRAEGGQAAGPAQEAPARWVARGEASAVRDPLTPDNADHHHLMPHGHGPWAWHGQGQRRDRSTDKQSTECSP
eukprot:7380950-Prymnesium_polylepis.1